jgi:hypothetical protein
VSENATNGRKGKPRFAPGQWVAYTIGNSRHVAEVLQDLGPVGNRQVRYYKLREPMWYGEPEEYEFAETSLEPATQSDLDSRYPPEEREVKAG